MARNEAPPFERGKTYFQGTPSDVTAKGFLEGKCWVFEGRNWSQSSSGVRTDLTGRYTVCMVVRNLSGGLLLPKLIAKMKTDGTSREFLGQVMGLATVVGEFGFPIDEYLPAAGVAANDLFWLVVGGLATCVTAAAGDTNISTGSFVIPSTGGKVIDQDTTVAAGVATFNQIQGAIGRCVLGVNAINTDIQIDVKPRIAFA